jgi:hypothetical protein
VKVKSRQLGGLYGVETCETSGCLSEVVGWGTESAERRAEIAGAGAWWKVNGER